MADTNDKELAATDAVQKGFMKKTALVILLVLIVAVVCELHGFKRGFARGEKVTNAWWIDQKSVMYDTSELLKKNILNRYNCL